ncbi:major pollen allergen Ole e 10-like [Salvia miltiorrhiza]|uniref:major pollen allergen Ole e 10-like n=1 Tax=Salvia miltiorrhiza TaxID=226208 RepID=UPI0025AC517A|nr:major pollen allergen Ole e 10-like [Salvia miltiorrhiza]
MMKRTISIINPYILALSTLLAFTNCISSYDSLGIDSIKNATSTPMAQFQPTLPYQTPQNYPPLCTYPPPSASTPSTTAGLPPPTQGPPTPPAPASAKPGHASWCVAKPTVPAPTIQQALDYACASGADCRPTQVGGACSQPDTVVAHASYAFNSYWQKTKSIGGTCDFGGSAMIVTVDPSYDQCHFLST